MLIEQIIIVRYFIDIKNETNIYCDNNGRFGINNTHN